MSKGKFIPAKALKSVTTTEEAEVEAEESQILSAPPHVEETVELLDAATAKSAFSFYKNEQSGRYFVVELKYDPNTLYAEVSSVLDVGPDRQEAIQTFKIKASDLM